VFHSPQELHLPTHFGELVPQLWQTKVVLALDTRRVIRNYQLGIINYELGIMNYVRQLAEGIRTLSN
jgi:hypothetical protein